MDQTKATNDLSDYIVLETDKYWQEFSRPLKLHLLLRSRSRMISTHALDTKALLERLLFCKRIGVIRTTNLAHYLLPYPVYKAVTKDQTRFELIKSLLSGDRKALHMAKTDDVNDGFVSPFDKALEMIRGDYDLMVMEQSLTQL